MPRRSSLTKCSPTACRPFPSPLVKCLALFALVCLIGCDTEPPRIGPALLPTEGSAPSVEPLKPPPSVAPAPPPTPAQVIPLGTAISAAPIASETTEEDPIVWDGPGVVDRPPGVSFGCEERSCGEPCKCLGDYECLILPPVQGFCSADGRCLATMPDDCSPLDAGLQAADSGITDAGSKDVDAGATDAGTRDAGGTDAGSNPPMDNAR